MEEEAEKTAAEDEPLLKKKCVMNMVPSKPEVDRTSDSSETDSKLIKVAAPIKMSLAAQKSKESGTIIKKSAAVAHAFNPDEDSDEEEMPPEAKMRMRNIGRDTPTAAGPNSYGKNRLGFCDRHRIFEREMKKKMEEVADKDG